MKKFVIAILAILYLASSVGATIHFHYCMGKLTKWELLKVKDECITCKTSKHNNHQKHKCCNDEFKAFKNGDQKLNETTIHLIQAPNTAGIIYVPEWQIVNTSSVAESNSILTVSRRSRVAEYILNCVFLI